MQCESLGELPWDETCGGETFVRGVELEQAEREAKAAEELAQCSFKPDINSRSKELMKDRATIMKEYKKTAHELLFLDAERRRERKEEYETYVPQDATFQPNTSSMFNTEGGSNNRSVGQPVKCQAAARLHSR
jgi:hypothetical protein